MSDRTVWKMNEQARNLVRDSLRENKADLGDFYVTEEEARRLFHELGHYKSALDAKAMTFHGMRLNVVPDAAVTGGITPE